MRIVSMTLAGTTEHDGTLPRAFATLHQNYEGAYIHADVHLPNGSRSHAVHFHPTDDDQRHEAAGRLATILDGSDGTANACLQAVEKMMNVTQAPVELPLEEAIRNNLYPETVAIIASRLQAEIETDDDAINDQYRWLAELMATLAGGWDEVAQTAEAYGIE